MVVVGLGQQSAGAVVIAGEVLPDVLFHFGGGYVGSVVYGLDHLVVFPQSGRVGPRIIAPIECLNKPKHMDKFMNLQLDICLTAICIVL